MAGVQGLAIIPDGRITVGLTRVTVLDITVAVVSLDFGTRSLVIGVILRDSSRVGLTSF